MIHQYQAKYTFENGYGASVVRGIGTYGGGQGLFELAVMHGKELCYATTVTDDVVGHCDEQEIADILKAIEKLSINILCDHQRREPRMFEISVRYFTKNPSLTAADVSAIAEESIQYGMNGDDWYEYLKVVGGEA